MKTNLLDLDPHGLVPLTLPGKGQKPPSDAESVLGNSDRVSKIVDASSGSPANDLDTQNRLRDVSMLELERSIASLMLESPELREYVRRSNVMFKNRHEHVRVFSDILTNDQFLVVDLEATCFGPQDVNRDAPAEVIEVGCALLDLGRMDGIERHQLYVRPTTMPVSDFCTELTGISLNQVETAPAFVASMALLSEFIRDRGIRVWGSYGGFDRNQFVRQCKREGVANPMEPLKHINLKELAGRHFGFGKSTPGLRKMLTIAGLEPIGRLHSGVDDAVNIARLFEKLMAQTDVHGQRLARTSRIVSAAP